MHGGSFDPSPLPLNKVQFVTPPGNAAVVHTSWQQQRRRQAAAASSSGSDNNGSSTVANSSRSLGCSRQWQQLTTPHPAQTASGEPQHSPAGKNKAWGSSVVGRRAWGHTFGDCRQLPGQCKGQPCSGLIWHPGYPGSQLLSCPPGRRRPGWPGTSRRRACSEGRNNSWSAVCNHPTLNWTRACCPPSSVEGARTCMQVQATMRPATNMSSGFTLKRPPLRALEGLILKDACIGGQHQQVGILLLLDVREVGVVKLEPLRCGEGRQIGVVTVCQWIGPRGKCASWDGLPETCMCNGDHRNQQACRAPTAAPAQHASARTCTVQEEPPGAPGPSLVYLSREGRGREEPAAVRRTAKLSRPSHPSV